MDVESRTMPSPHLCQQARVHALEHLADWQFTHTREIQIIEPAHEAGGMFVYPDRRFALGEGRRPCVPQFVRLKNAIEHPRSIYNFESDTEQLERAIGLQYGGLPSAHLQLFHSHLYADQVSDIDFENIRGLEKWIAGHPIWGLTPNHWVFTIQSQTWHDYDRERQIS